MGFEIGSYLLSQLYHIINMLPVITNQLLFLFQNLVDELLMLFVDLLKVLGTKLSATMLGPLEQIWFFRCLEVIVYFHFVGVGWLELGLFRVWLALRG